MSKPECGCINVTSKRIAELEAENERLRYAIQEHKDAHVGEEIWVIGPDKKLWAALEGQVDENDAG